MTILRELKAHRRLAGLEHRLRQSDPTLVADFHRSLPAKRRLHACPRWIRLGLATFAFCWLTGLGVALGTRIDAALGVAVSTVPTLILAWYFTRVPVVRERRVAGAPPLHRSPG